VFGVAVRLAAGVAGAMLLLSVLKEVLRDTLIPPIENILGADHLLVESLGGALDALPAIVLLTGALAFVYRGVIEHRAAGG
jgi:hypothetical protein